MDKETKEYFIRIEKRLDNTLTKEDAKNFLTKEDAKNFATKDDLKNYATKDELKDFRKETKANFDIMWYKYENLKKEMNTGFEKIMKELEIAREDRQFYIAKDKEQDKRLDKLEVKVGLA